ncbi:MAG TPA: succinylglutamate desuccinylase/aspartoacylase family protein [Vicinamibacterales bacterium]|nr:succinylglutamate desuccinylase/aspartoacylase family protein [Vicinamibacterales bacterium]
MAATGVIEIRGVRAARGERARGFVQIGETATGPIRIPVVIVNGAEPGPTLSLTAGVHATEYPPIDAVMRTVNELDPQHLRGAVIAVPVANTTMFASRMPFVSPIDGLNLNKIAPGNAEGTISEVLAHVLLQDIIGVSEYYIDLHGGDIGEALLPFVACSITGNADLDRKAELLARLYSPDVISLSADGATVPPFAGSIVHSAARQGIVALFAEAGGDGTLEEADVQVHVNGIKNVLRYLRAIEGDPHLVGARSKGTRRFVMRARRSGLVRLKVAIGDRIAEGQEIAEICNMFGETVEVVRSTGDGTAGLIWTHKVVNSGDPLVRCWVTELAPPLPEFDRLSDRVSEGVL